MARPFEAYTIYAVWYRRAIHLWAFNGHEAASTTRLLRAIGIASRGWDTAGVSPSLVQPEPLLLGHGHRHRELAEVPSLRVEACDLPAVLTAIPHDERSQPLRWFAAVHRFAEHLIDTAHLAPHIALSAADATVEWTAVVDDPVASAIEELARTMPPICVTVAPTAAISATDRAQLVIDEYLDRLARTRLMNRRWRADTGRGGHLATIRRVFAALGGPDPTLSLHQPARGERPTPLAGEQPNTDLPTLEQLTIEQLAIEHLARLFSRHRQQLAGIPVVEPRLRLVPPGTAHEQWSVILELTDATGGWCTARQVRDGDPAAVDLAGGATRLVHLAAVVADTGRRLAERIDVLSGFANGTLPTEVHLSVDETVAFLERAEHEIRPGITALGDIGLIGPEHLVMATVRIRGAVTPVPADDRTGRLSTAAIIDWTPMIDGHHLDRTEFERIVDAGTTLVHSGGRWVRLDPDDLRRARRFLQGRSTNQPVAARDLIDLLGDADHVVDLHLERTAGDWVERFFHDGDTSTTAGHDDGAEPDQFVGALRQYQRRGLAWMRSLARAGLGGCLADDMGLGKTATTLAHLVGRPGPHLVICPLSVVHNWEDEARRFTPTLQVRVHHGAGRTGLEPRSLTTDDLVLTTYGLITRDHDLHTIEWSTVVFDEAQMIKNPATRAARSARRLQARQKLALTGTPVENRLAELWSILDTVNPGLLGTQSAFRERFSAPIERSGDDAAVERLRRITRPFVLRRTKDDRSLIPELPDKIEQIAYATLTDEQRVLYNEVVEQLLGDAARLSGIERRGNVLAAITRLKQICNHPAQALGDGTPLPGRSGKLLRFDQLVADLREIGERALVFTQFREMGALLQQHLSSAHGLDIEFLHGGLARGRRAAIVDAFQHSADQPLLIISLRAGGTGLNLTGASQVIHYDRWWNPAVEDQATDRAWRIGQDRVVNVHKLVCRHTIEERIGQVLDDKRELAGLAVAAGESWLTELSTDELERLVVLDDQPAIAGERVAR